MDYEVSYLFTLLETTFNYLVNQLLLPIVNLAVKSISSEGMVRIDLRSKPLVLPLGKGLTSLVNVSIEEVIITGLDSFKDPHLEPSSSGSSNVTLTSHFTFENLGVTVLLRVHSNIVSGGYSKQFKTDFKAAESTVVLDVAIAINNEKIEESFVYQLLFEPPCFIKTVGYAHITSLQVHTTLVSATAFEVVLQSSTPNNSNGLQQQQQETLGLDVLAAADDIILLFLDGYGPLLTDMIAGAMQGPLRTLFNEMLDSKLTELAAQCPQFQPLITQPPKLVPWPGNFLVGELDDALNHLVGPGGLNWALGPGQTSLNVWGWDMALILNSFTNFSVLVPSKVDNKPYSLINTIEWHDFQVAIKAPGNAKFSKQPSLNTFMSPFFSGYSFFPLDSTLYLNMTRFYVVLDALIQENLDKFMNLKVKQLVTDGCIVSTLEGISINSMRWGFQDASMKIVRGESYDVKWGGGDVRFERDVSFFMSLVISGLNSPRVLHFLNSQLSTLHNTSAPICANNGTYTPFPSSPPTALPETSKPSDMVIAIVFFGALTLFAWSAYELYQWRNGVAKRRPFSYLCCCYTWARYWMEKKEKRPEREINKESREAEESKQQPSLLLQESLFTWLSRHWYDNGCDKIMLFSPHINPLVRIFALFITVSTIILFIFNNLTYNAVTG